MKNQLLIREIAPNLLEDFSLQHRAKSFWNPPVRLLVWVTFVILLCCLGVAVAAPQGKESDPLVMKIYPDGTKVVLRWSEVGKQIDNGERFGGAPRIVAYDPAKDGLVPIGEPAQKTPAATNSASSAGSSVVLPQAPAKMDYTDADPKDFEEDLGPREGFCFRSAVGVAYQQPLSGRDSNGFFGTANPSYNRLVFQPGIRFDLEPSYNVTDWFRIGMETSFIYNELHSLTANGTTFYPGGSDLGNGGLYQIPILGNVSFHFPSEGPIRGYLGGGTGAAWTVLQISGLGGDPYTSNQWNYVWQTTAGLTYTVAPGLDLDLAYKMLSAPSPNFRNQNAYKSSYNHSAELGLVWRF